MQDKKEGIIITGDNGIGFYKKNLLTGKILNNNSVNIQAWDSRKPNEKETVMRLNLIDDGKAKEFVATNSVKLFIKGETKSIMFLSTNEKGKKQGMILEWVERKDVWKSSDPEFLENIEKFGPSLYNFIMKHGSASIPVEVLENLRGINEGCPVCRLEINLKNIKIHPVYFEAGVNTYKCDCGHRCFVAI